MTSGILLITPEHRTYLDNYYYNNINNNLLFNMYQISEKTTHY